jgi:hypothetical protein
VPPEIDAWPSGAPNLVAPPDIDAWPSGAPNLVAPPEIDAWPSGALNLAREGAAEISSVIAAIRATGAGAPPYSEATGHSASSFHVHVNARHRTAGGEQLTDREVLAVWAAWVRFDLVTAR